MTKIKTKKPSVSTTDEVLEKVIKPLIAKLEGMTDELKIKTVTIAAWQLLNKVVPSEGSLSRHRTNLRKAIERAFLPSEVQKPGYYFTCLGKGKDSRYEHLALWYATKNEARWDVVGDAARAEYFKNLPSLPQEQPSSPVDQQLSIEQPQSPLTLSDMTLEHLGLDAETEKMVKDTLAHSDMALSDFLRQACKVYAKTVMGRVGQVNDDLSAVSTTALKEEAKYKTHPGRPAELVKRAIKAIKLHNAQATELVYKWGITQTLLQELTGSRPAMVKQLMQQYKTDVDDYNAQLMANYGLDETKFRYLNRKDKSVQKPDLVALVPDGL